MIIMQASVQIGLNWYWTGTELGKITNDYIYPTSHSLAIVNKHMHVKESTETSCQDSEIIQPSSANAVRYRVQDHFIVDFYC